MISSRMRASAKRALFVFFAGLLAGCSRAPSVDVMGSFFPGWLVCVIVGIVFAAVARLALLRLRIKVALPILVYPSLAAIFTFVLWLLFYS
jgi:hypothetical protein